MIYYIILQPYHTSDKVYWTELLCLHFIHHILIWGNFLQYYCLHFLLWGKTFVMRRNQSANQFGVWQMKSLSKYVAHEDRQGEAGDVNKKQIWGLK